MAKANSDNTGTNGALDKFFSVFNSSSGASTYKNIDILMNDVFCADDPAAGIPWVGIARHGPQFRGSANVKGLFQQLITTFPDIWWAEFDDPSPNYARAEALFERRLPDPDGRRPNDPLGHA